VRSKIQWFAGFCNSHHLSRFAAFFIDARTKRSVVKGFDFKFLSFVVFGRRQEGASPPLPLAHARRWDRSRWQEFSRSGSSDGKGTEGKNASAGGGLPRSGRSLRTGRLAGGCRGRAGHSGHGRPPDGDGCRDRARKDEAVLPRGPSEPAKRFLFRPSPVIRQGN
jgi:hypothetical protein